jgi:hypothetical protein
MPEKLWGRVAGKTTRRRYSALERARMRASSRYLPGTAAAPEAVLRKMGQNAPIKTTKIADARKVGRRAISYGMYMVGGIGGRKRRGKLSERVERALNPRSGADENSPEDPGKNGQKIARN